MQFSLQQLTQDTTPILTLDEVKDHLRIDDTNSDTYLASLTERATQLIEWETNVDLRTTQWLYKGHFPRVNRLVLPRGPLQLDTIGDPTAEPPIAPTYEPLVTIQYFDTANVQQTWAASNYSVMAGRKTLPAIIASTYYPGTYPYRQDQIWVTFTTGWNPAPELAKQAALLLLGGWYENREDPTEANVKTLPTGFDRLIAQLQIEPQA